MPNLAVTLAAVSVIVITLYFILPRKSLINGGRASLEFAALITPMLTALALLFQWYNSWLQEASLRSDAHNASVDRLWNSILDYMTTNYEHVKLLYSQMFKEEYELIKPEDPDRDSSLVTARGSNEASEVSETGRITSHEIRAAHKVAQVTEDFINMDLSQEDRRHWLPIFERWWRSERLRKIWPSISYAYDPNTKLFIEYIIKGT